MTTGTIWPVGNGILLGNPILRGIQSGIEAVHHQYNQLMYLDPYQGAQAIVPDLARAWRYDDRGTVLTLELERNARWHDGKPFQAADVVHSFQVRLTPPEGWLSGLVQDKLKGNVKAAQAVDANTARIELLKPSASFIPFLTLNAFKMIPSHIPVQEQPAKGIGTGPFRVKEVKRDVSIEFVRNPDYWNKDAAGRQLPYLDGMLFNHIPDPALLFAALRTGRALFINSVNPPAISGRERVLKDSVPGIQFFQNAEADYGIVFNNAPPFSDPRVREAVDLWVNRKEINDTGYEGGGNRGSILATPMRGPELKGRWSLPDEERVQRPGWRMVDGGGRTIAAIADFRSRYGELKKDPRDLQRAKQLLSDAGLRPGAVTFRFLTDRGTARGSESLATQLSDLFGSSIAFETLSPAEGNDRIVRGNFTVAFVTLGAGAGIDEPEFDLQAWIQGTFKSTWGKWDHSPMAPLFTEQDATLDTARRRDLLWRIQRQILTDRFHLPLIWPESVAVAWPQVRNVPPPIGSGDNSLWYERIWLAP